MLGWLNLTNTTLKWFQSRELNALQNVHLFPNTPGTASATMPSGHWSISSGAFCGRIDQQMDDRWQKINWKVWHDALQRGNKWKGQGLVHSEAFCALYLNQRCWKDFSHWQAWPLWLSGAVWLQRANRFKIWLYKHWPYSNRLWWVSLSNPHIRISHTFSHFSLNFYHDSPRLCLVQNWWGRRIHRVQGKQQCHGHLKFCWQNIFIKTKLMKNEYENLLDVCR